MSNKHLLLRRILEKVAGKVSIPSGNLLNLFASGRGEDTVGKACRPPTWAILVVVMSQDILWIYVFAFLGFGKVYGCDMIQFLFYSSDIGCIHVLQLNTHEKTQVHKSNFWNPGSKASKDQASFWEDITMFKDRIPKSILEVFIRCSSKAPTMRTQQLLWMTAKKEEQKKRGGWVCKRNCRRRTRTYAAIHCVLCPFGCRRVQHIVASIDVSCKWQCVWSRR